MYATVAEADEYIASYYSSTDNLRLQWEDLDDEDKAVSLRKSSQFIDLLPYKGKASSHNGAFPRKPNEEYSLQQAKIATIELALNKLDTEAASRFQLMDSGVKSYKIGDLSETFRDSESLLYGAGIDPYQFSIVFPFLRDWIGGGYDICPTHIRKCCGRRVG